MTLPGPSYVALRMPQRKKDRALNTYDSISAVVSLIRNPATLPTVE